MTPLQRIASIFILFSVITVSAEAGMRLKPGTWEMSIKMTGMPVEIPAVKQRFCVTKANPVPVDKRQHKDCKFKWRTKDNNLFWTMRCDNGANAKAKYTYKWDRMFGHMVMNTGGRSFESTIRGRWLRSGCKKKYR